MRLKPKLLLVAGLILTGCGISSGGAGCVAYQSSAFTVDPARDTSETIAGIAGLEAAMEAACE